MIVNAIETTATPRLFITEGRTFRYDLAKTKPYKGTRKGEKPWHYENLAAYMKGVLGADIVTGIEADDAMAIEQVKGNGTTIICSRDKDLRQVPGWFYSWELGRQPSFGPNYSEDRGTISLHSSRKKIVGDGLAFFYSQVLTGDTVDNIPGLDGCGPVKAFSILDGADDMLMAVREEFEDDELLTEMGQLCWMVRRLNPDGTPQIWHIGLEK